MVKVIKEGTKRRVECKECGAILEYEKHDKCNRQTGINEYESYIICPCCENDIVVRITF